MVQKSTDRSKNRKKFSGTTDKVKMILPDSRDQLIRRMAGWMTHQEVEDLRKAVTAFTLVDEKDWFC